MSAINKLNRRSFIKVSSATGGGLLFGFNWFISSQATAGTSASAAAFEPNAFIKISPEGIVTLMAPNPEIGQGVKTAFPLIVAEELDVDWEKVQVEQAPLAPEKFDRQVAGGSGSVRSSWDTLRQAGGAARSLLVAAAANEWKANPDECATELGFVIHKPSGKKLSYGELADKAARLPAPSDVKVKNLDEFNLLGKRIKNVDNKAIVTGKAKYGIDTKREGMLYAIVERPPAFGKKLKSFDDTETKKTHGVKDVISFDNKIAILADSTWAAKKGREALKAEWEDDGELESTAGHLEKFKAILAAEPEKNIRKDGDVKSAFSKPLKIIEGTFEAPFLPHSTMEPMNFFADVKENSVELYGPTQTPDRARKAVSELLNIPEENISVMTTRMGGGFGRRLKTDFVTEAVQISQKVKAPVQVIWTREDDMQGGIYRPAGMYHYKAGIDAQNRLVAWHLKATAVNSGNGTRENNFPAGAVPNFQVDFTNLESQITTGAWRAPNHNFIAFTEESFLDDIAHAMQKDPVAFRLELLEQAKASPAGEVAYDIDRYKNVIETAAEKAGWGKPMPEGVFQGFGSHFSFGSYVAQVADIQMRGSNFRVLKVTCVVDCGIVVNLSGAETQVEGGIVDGLGHALYGELTFENGATAQKNYDKYRLIRMKDTPEMEVHFIKSTENPQGLGEPGLPPIAAAVGNAIFAATGKRVRKLPFSRAELG